VVGEHPRCFGRGQTVYDPWHYVPVLARKPGALRNGAPFKHWVLPAALERVRPHKAPLGEGAAVSSLRPTTSAPLAERAERPACLRDPLLKLGELVGADLPVLALCGRLGR
jgi:hypothetical protein